MKKVMVIMAMLGILLTACGAPTPETVIVVETVIVEITAEPIREVVLDGIGYTATFRNDDGIIEIPDGTICILLDDVPVKFGSGITAAPWYKVDCQGKIGYVMVEQATLIN